MIIVPRYRYSNNSHNSVHSIIFSEYACIDITDNFYIILFQKGHKFLLVLYMP